MPVFFVAVLNQTFYLYNKVMKKSKTKKQDSDFRKLHKNIFWSVFLIPSVLAFILSIVTSSLTYSLYKNSFQSSFQSQISLLSSRFQRACVQFESQLNAQAENENFKKACEVENENQITKGLGDLALSNSCFLGSLFYSENLVASSSEVGGAPSLKQLLSREDFSSFYYSSKDSFCFIRKENIANTYLSFPYQSDLGIFSYFKKVFSDTDKFLGILEIDLSTQDIYDRYLSVSKRTFRQDALVSLSYKDSVLLTPGRKQNENPIRLGEKGIITSYQKSYIRKTDFSSSLRKNTIDGFTIRISIPKWNFRQVILYINLGIISVLLLCILFFFFIAKRKADKDCQRLDAISYERKTEREKEEV